MTEPVSTCACTMPVGCRKLSTESSSLLCGGVSVSPQTFFSRLGLKAAAYCGRLSQGRSAGEHRPVASAEKAGRLARRLVDLTATGGLKLVSLFFCGPIASSTQQAVPAGRAGPLETAQVHFFSEALQRCSAASQQFPVSSLYLPLLPLVPYLASLLLSWLSPPNAV